jgi:hypothetical protein
LYAAHTKRYRRSVGISEIDQKIRRRRIMNNKSVVVAFWIGVLAVGMVMAGAVVVGTLVGVVRKVVELAQGEAQVTSGGEWAIAFAELPKEVEAGEKEIVVVAPLVRRKREEVPAGIETSGEGAPAPARRRRKPEAA